MDLNDPRLLSIFDELPLWSAPFGLRLLERVQMSPGLQVLDLGCGAGFPLLELAQRLGPGCRAIGLDPWWAGLRRAREKVVFTQAAQVRLVRGVGEQIPLRDGSIDLVVSNNGLNNVADLGRTLAECRRVARPGAQLVATMNLPETMALFYSAFERTLDDLGLGERVAAVRRHIHEKRKTVAETREALQGAGFTVEAEILDRFDWRFADGRALFAHFFIRLAFLDGWRAAAGEGEGPRVLAALERGLDQVAAEQGELRLAVPFVCFDCRRAPAA